MQSAANRLSSSTLRVLGLTIKIRSSDIRVEIAYATSEARFATA